MKKILASLLSLVMLLGLTACGGNGGQSTEQSTATEEDGNNPAAIEQTEPDETPKTLTVKAGLICLGDENDQGYTYNFIRGRDDATAALATKGINVDWVTKCNVDYDSSCEDTNRELVGDGCQIIFNNSYGFEPFMLKVAPKYSDIQFVSFTTEFSWRDDLSNTHNAFAAIYEGWYLAGIVAGMKLQQMIDNGELAPEEAVIGCVAAYAYAEVISGYTAYFLGARSVCPGATMKVMFVNAWSDAPEEAKAAALVEQGCKVICQQSDNTAPATVAQEKGVFHTGYMNDMTNVAPNASLVSVGIDWAPYFEYVIEAVANGQEFEQDWCGGMDTGAVFLTPLNEQLTAPGTAEKVAEAEAAIKDGSLPVFDTSTFTVNGAELTHAFAMDTDGDLVPDSGEAVFDGAFHESYFQSAPYFNLDIDGIEKLN